MVLGFNWGQPGNSYLVFSQWLRWTRLEGFLTHVWQLMLAVSWNIPHKWNLLVLKDRTVRPAHHHHYCILLIKQHARVQIKGRGYRYQLSMGPGFRTLMSIKSAKWAQLHNEDPLFLSAQTSLLLARELLSSFWRFSPPPPHSGPVAMLWHHRERGPWWKQSWGTKKKIPDDSWTPSTHVVWKTIILNL